MKPVFKLAAVAGAATAASAMFIVPASAATIGHAADAATSGVVFAQNDATSGNQVIAYARTASGGLTQVGSYATGGVGGQEGGSVVDHLGSEGSVAYDAQARLLYVSNAGSNTITVFAVHGDSLTRTQVIGSGGEFPVSIAARGGLVYVLNARDGGSVAGFVRIGDRLVSIPGWHRDLGLNPEQTPEFTSTPGEIAFTPDGGSLVVTTKNGANTVDVFKLGLFGPALSPAVTSLPSDVPYGFGFDAYGHLDLAEAGPNTVATFAVRHDGQLSTLDTAATGQNATCWLVADGNLLFASNAGSGTISIYRVSAGGQLTSLGTASTDGGTVDATVSGDGQYLYVGTGADGVIDAFRIGANGSLTATGSATIPGGVGAEGIVAP
jgi:DNA-binding beta-propeller fold protein YncE